MQTPLFGDMLMTDSMLLEIVLSSRSEIIDDVFFIGKDLIFISGALSFLRKQPLYSGHPEI